MGPSNFPHHLAKHGRDASFDAESKSDFLNALCFVWLGFVWLGLALFCLAWFDLAWLGLALLGFVLLCLALLDFGHALVLFCLFTKKLNSEEKISYDLVMCW